MCSIPRRTAGLAALLLVLSAGCHIPPEALRPIGFARPPSPGQPLKAQPLMLGCVDRHAALQSSRTGFIAAGCGPLSATTLWRVIGRSLVALDEGGVWLLEIVDEAGHRLIVPLPWHDWA